ncbi:hypothetical protein [Stagnihabitans tardus]|uniref:Uncharacterized protein n=1 Tax=Stagnihabitans tardus TaxID=2699202 RepID=A0AAE5BX72_9RHOB|nr:hypothetical protein [Stagnihabitans tardus]NBZ90067.1 hypothetical protein [Stagnihabitans tardus]
MDNRENWTFALTAASVAEAEGFTETAKAFAEIAAMEMDISSLFDGTCRPNRLALVERNPPSPEFIFSSVRIR